MKNYRKIIKKPKGGQGKNFQKIKLYRKWPETSKNIKIDAELKIEFET